MNTDRQIAKRLACWKPLREGQRVRSRIRYMRGCAGTVAEVLPSDAMNGYARYGVAMDIIAHGPEHRGIADFCRFELSAIPKGKER